LDYDKKFRAVFVTLNCFYLGQISKPRNISVEPTFFQQ